MVRHFLRIFCVVGLIVIIGMAVVGQFRQFDLYWPHGFLILFVSGGVVIQSYVFTLVSGGRYWTIDYFPWWLILISWGLLTALTWFMTRRRKVSQGFPVEPTANPK